MYFIITGCFDVISEMKQGLTIAEGFFYKPVAYYEFVHCGSCSLTSKRNTQQQKHGFTEKPEHGWNTFSDLQFQVFSKTRSNSAASHFSAVWGCECIMWSSSMYTLSIRNHRNALQNPAVSTRCLAHNESRFNCFFLDATAQSTPYVNRQLYHLPDPLCTDEQK